LTIQLEKLLKQFSPHKPWGLNKHIRERTGLGLAKIRELRTNTAKSISMDTLQKIVGYLVNECHIPASELLGSLFGIGPSAFWGMFTSSTSDFFKVQICEGVRDDKDTAEPTWINAYDAFCSAALIRQLVANHAQPQPDLEHCMLHAYSDRAQQKETFDESRNLYERFRRGGGGRALVCIGSMKSLPLCECVIARTFGVRPFVRAKNVSHPRDLPLPVFFQYRVNDPHPPSAFGGRNFPSAPAGQAGIAYEVDETHWDFCPISETQDAALVFYVCRPPEDTVEVVFAGFSGRATGCIALTLPDLANQLWPPLYQQSQLMVGAFIIRYEFPPRHAKPHPMLVNPAKAQVIAISADVLIRRLADITSAPTPVRTPTPVSTAPAKNSRAVRRRKPR